MSNYAWPTAESWAQQVNEVSAGGIDAPEIDLIVCFLMKIGCHRHSTLLVYHHHAMVVDALMQYAQGPIPKQKLAATNL